MVACSSLSHKRPLSSRRRLRDKERGDERALTDPVVLQVSVDGTDVFRKVDIDTSGDPNEKCEEEGVWQKKEESMRCIG